MAMVHKGNETHCGDLEFGEAAQEVNVGPARLGRCSDVPVSESHFDVYVYVRACHHQTIAAQSRVLSPIRGALAIEVNGSEACNAQSMKGCLFVLFLQPRHLCGGGHTRMVEIRPLYHTSGLGSAGTTCPMVSSGVVVGKLARAKMAWAFPLARHTETEVPLPTNSREEQLSSREGVYLHHGKCV